MVVVIRHWLRHVFVDSPCLVTTWRVVIKVEEAVIEKV